MYKKVGISVMSRANSAAQGGKGFQEAVISKLRTEGCTQIQQRKDCFTSAHRGNRIHKDPEIRKHGTCLENYKCLYVSWGLNMNKRKDQDKSRDVKRGSIGSD